MFLPVCTMGVRALRCLRVSSWEDRALEGDSGHCNNSHCKKCAQNRCGHQIVSAMCSAGTVRGSAVLGHGLHRPGSQESCVTPLKQGSYVAFHCFSLLSYKMSTRHFGRCTAANRKYEREIGWNQFEKQVRVKDNQCQVWGQVHKLEVRIKSQSGWPDAQNFHNVYRFVCGSQYQSAAKRLTGCQFF